MKTGALLGMHKQGYSNQREGDIELFTDSRGMCLSYRCFACVFAPTSVLVTTSKALVTSSDALVPSRFLLLQVRHLFFLRHVL